MGSCKVGGYIEHYDNRVRRVNICPDGFMVNLDVDRTSYTRGYLSTKKKGDG